jgi:hypothetical protein
MTGSQSTLWTEETKRTGTGTLFTDADGFVGVELKFGIHTRHPENEKLLLREWVSDFPGAAWKKAAGAWVVPDVRDIPRGWLKRAGIVVQHADGTPARPSDLAEPPAPRLERATTLKTLPKWFGYEPFDDQLEGAELMVNGRNFLGDEPGGGKTITALATAALLQSKRTLVLCQPVALTHWYRSSERSGLPAHVGGTTVMIRSGRKQPALPEAGVVIVSAALVTNRPDLARELAEWQPMAFFLDESQQVMTWSSRRSRVLRRLARSCSIGIPMTGTPSPGATPMDFGAQLDIAGMLQPTFGSFLELRSRYMRRTKFGWKVNKTRVVEFNEILETLWVRRIKNKRPVLRSMMEADYDVAVYEEALVEVNNKIDEWFDEFKEEHARLPSNDDDSEFGNEVKAWCSGRGDLTSRLREAAGLAKVPFAIEFIKEYMKANAMKNGEYPRPLIVWAHHHSVTAALMKGVEAFDPMMIDGTSSHTQRTLAEDQYQAGHVGVLVCSIKAAGTSITLTRGNEALFVELDWTPDNIIQAERRQNRIGQEADHVIYTTLIALGTLDERVADVLFGKSGVLEAMTGGDYAVVQKAPSKAGGPVFASTILREMVNARLALAA